MAAHTFSTSPDRPRSRALGGGPTGWLALWLAPLCLASAACSYRTDAVGYETLGPSDGPFTLVASDPADGDEEVRLGAAVTLRFGAFPDPAAVLPVRNLSLRSGALTFDFTASVDLVDKAIVLRKSSPFAARTQYDVVLSGQLAALDGDTLGATQIVRFTTGDEAGGGLPAPPTPRLVDLQPWLTSDCAFGGCHTPSGGFPAAANLDLSEDVAYASLVGVTATEHSEMARVVPGAPAESYLLRKLLGTPGIAGQQMPPTGSTWPADRIRAVSDWIAAGAQP